MEFQVYTVSGLTRELKALVEESFPPVWVEGEISNFKHHSSGHMYFSLKDEGATLRCVFFRQYNMRLRYRPEDGMKVLAFGELTVYEPSGQYQLVVAELRPRGVGELQLAFEQLKIRLQAEGLFDPEHKKPIPQFPEVVGVVTSSTGAVIRDIISVIRRRCPPVRIVLYPARVQGEGAAAEIAEGIRAFGRWGGADVLIVGRGGGSIEDLWAFNEEEVARAIYESPVPVVSAVGHETDFTIADFVADLRAPTPSAAAEFVVSDAAELSSQVESLVRSLTRAQHSLLETSAQQLDELERGLSAARLLERLKIFRTLCQALEYRLRRAIAAKLTARKSEWLRLRGALSALNPAAVLDRGFSLVRKPSGAVVRDAVQVAVGEVLEVILSRGLLDCRVERAEPEARKLKLAGLPEKFFEDLKEEKRESKNDKRKS
ncbi:MAG TPA: exodeoxyribonuclease VII large subunit [archaeon]|nr:exodeoxyribonuclease VII large subunit [archaeon]